MPRNLVLFDLEWNIGYQPYTFNYHGVQQTLRGEIVEIGAVKIDEDANVLDTFSIHLRPRIFRKLQHHIAKVTGLTQADLDKGEPIVQGLRRFMQWCGPDAEFAEWGMDDVPVLKQNLYLCNIDESKPTVWYDLQQVFLREHPRKEGEGMTLESVVTRMGIPMERPFHDALSDTLYTADVCRLLDLRAGLAAYPTEDEALRQSLCQTPGDYRDFTVFHGYVEQYAWRADPKISQMPCPECGTTLQPDEIWLKKGSNSWYTLCQCPSCTGSSNAAGQGVFQRYKLSRRDGLHWSFARCAQMPDAESLARWEKLRTAQLERVEGKDNMQFTAVVRCQKSTDGGKTWGDYTTVFPEEGTFCRQPIQVLSNGRWIFANWLCTDSAEGLSGDPTAFRISDDEGKTWRMVMMPGSNGHVHANVIELEPGHLVAFMRNREAYRIHRSESFDWGETWTVPAPTPLPNNNSSISAVKLQSGRIAIAYNPTCTPNPVPGKAAWPGLRCPVAVALSEDGGLTFPIIRWMERGEGYMGDENKTNNKQYEYPYLMQGRDGMLHLAYAARTRQGIKYVRFSEQDVLGAKRETVGLYNPTAAQSR